MTLKFIKPKYTNKKLYKLALQIAIEELVINGDYETVASARNSVIRKAKKQYNERK